MSDPVRSRPLRLAHRGDWRSARENSIPALVAALDLPACDGLEFDVRLSRDGVPVLLHDVMLVRVQGVDARVDQLTAPELRGHAIPTLADALEAIDSRRTGAFLDIELKGVDHAASTAGVIAAARAGMAAATVVSSFEPMTLSAMRTLLPGIGTWLNTDDLSTSTIQLARDLGCRGMSVQHRALDDQSVRAAHAAGLEVAAWTLRSRADADRIGALGVVAMCVEDEALVG